MKYVTALNAAIVDVLRSRPDTVVFGQNIAAGSCLSGLTRGIADATGATVINTPNSENSLLGFGFGMMIGGASSIYFMKQLDFLLLGVDHLVNTYNAIRLRPPTGSFTIVPIIVDSGYQGLQSSFNALSDVCAVGRVQGFTIASRADVDYVLRAQLVAPGFRIIGVSQRLFDREIFEPANLVAHGRGGSWFQYADGPDASIVCFNLSLPQGCVLAAELQAHGVRSSVFGVSDQALERWDDLAAAAGQARRVIILDDTKSVRRPSLAFEARLRALTPAVDAMTVARDLDGDWLKPQADELVVDGAAMCRRLA